MGTREGSIPAPRSARRFAHRPDSEPSPLFGRLQPLAHRRTYAAHAALIIIALFAGALTIGRIGDGAGLPDVPGARSLALAVPPASEGNPMFGPAANSDTPGTAAGEETATPRPEVQYTTHVIEPGETLNSIAAEYGIDPAYLVWNNPGVAADPDLLIIGETLLVPGTSGLVYNVSLGDTINDIAALYGVDPASIASYGPNKLASPDLISEGMVLVLPGAVPPAPAEPEPIAEPVDAAPTLDTPAATDAGLPAFVAAEPVPEPLPQPAAVAAITPEPAPVPAPAPAPAPPPPPPAPSYGFIWPVGGPINSYFGPRWGSFHTGIDIGAAAGTGVAAAGTGQVVNAVYGDYGYGNYIMVRHADGSQTQYAHLSAIYVSVGQQVGQGEIIGAVGCTGWCTGPHLHFEVRIGGTQVDPLGYLP